MKLNGQKKLEKVTDKITQKHETIEKNKQEVAVLDTQIEELQKKRDEVRNEVFETVTASRRNCYCIVR